MIETRQLKIGDLVYADEGTLGMIEEFDIGYIKYKINWFGFESRVHTWMTVQRYRNNYLALRKDLV
jgi:hypothetical protein